MNLQRKKMLLTFDDFCNSQFSLRRSHQQQGYVGSWQSIYSTDCDKSNIKKVMSVDFLKE